MWCSGCLFFTQEAIANTNKNTESVLGKDRWESHEVRCREEDDSCGNCIEGLRMWPRGSCLLSIPRAWGSVSKNNTVQWMSQWELNNGVSRIKEKALVCSFFLFDECPHFKRSCRGDLLFMLNYRHGVRRAGVQAWEDAHSRLPEAQEGSSGTFPHTTPQHSSCFALAPEAPWDDCFETKNNNVWCCSRTIIPIPQAISLHTSKIRKEIEEGPEVC